MARITRKARKAVSSKIPNSNRFRDIMCLPCGIVPQPKGSTAVAGMPALGGLRVAQLQVSSWLVPASTARLSISARAGNVAGVGVCVTD